MPMGEFNHHMRQAGQPEKVWPDHIDCQCERCDASHSKAYYLMKDLLMFTSLSKEEQMDLSMFPLSQVIDLISIMTDYPDLGKHMMEDNDCKVVVEACRSSMSMD